MREMNGSRLLLGSCAVYLVVSACSGESKAPDARADQQSGAAGQSGEESGGHGGQGGEGIDEPEPPITISGERLRARYLQADDGTRQWLGWYDIERGENCSFRIAEDGVERCLPEVNADIAPNAYSDPNCTEELWGEIPSEVDCSPTRSAAYAIDPEDGCARVLYRVTEVPIPSTVYGGPLCVAGEPGGAVVRHFTVERVEPQEFVAAVEMVE